MAVLLKTGGTSGASFRAYMRAKKNHASDEELERLRLAYDQAQAETHALSRHDEAAIRAVLARPVED